MGTLQAFGLALCLQWAGVPVAATGGVDNEIRDFVDDYYTAGTAEVQGARLLTGPLLARFYAHRNFEPVWAEPGRVAGLLQLLAGAEAEGLDPEDYNLAQLQSLALETPPSVSAADLDLLYSESLFRFVFHLRFGKVDPQTLASSWNFRRDLAPGVDPVETLNEAVESSDLRGFMERRVSRGPLYHRVRQALETYRRIEAAGGWGTIAVGSTLRRGDADVRVTALRRRLAVTGDYPIPASAAPDPERFDQTLAQAVRRFQSRHNLEVDGIVGPATLRAMNVPVSDRIDQLRLTLERARWIMSEADRSVVVVNIAAGEVYVVEEGNWIWERRAIVGRSYRQTPLFRGLMTYLEINPTWTVPPGILRKDILPRVREDPGYLARSNMTLLDRSGNPVDPYSVDWERLRGMPYTFRQEPGPDNALGLIKFMFPNEHFVFLHDTPNRELFEFTERTFSSGCIRVEDPLELAAVLLGDPVDWSEDKIRAAVTTGRTRRINLTRPWPVYLLYWTAEADDEGTVRFFADVYQRDAAVLEALNAPVGETFPAPTVRAGDVR